MKTSVYPTVKQQINNVNSSQILKLYLDKFFLSQFIYSEENKYFNTPPLCKFSHPEIM